MTAGAHDAGGGIGRSAGTEAVKGLLVLAAVVIVGLFLMVKGLGDNETVAANADAPTTATTTPADDVETSDDAVAGDDAAPDDAETITTLAPADSETTLPPRRDPATVTVLTVNGGTGVGGIAGRASTIVAQSNYATATPTNASGGPSAVYFAEGYESDARAVAELFNVDPDTVVRALDPAAPPVDDLQGANIVVYLGADGVLKA